VGVIEVHPVRYVSETDEYESDYPLLGFIGLITCEAPSEEGETKTKTIKCTHHAASSIAMVCASSPYKESSQILKHVGGLELDTMTEFRVVDSVGTEFVQDVPAAPRAEEIAEITEKIRGNALETRVIRMNSSDHPEETDKIIRDAIQNGPIGVYYKDYVGPVIRIMYILIDGTGVPGIHSELAGVQGKQPDGSAKTFEAKIGAVFIVKYTIDGRPLLTENGEIYRDKNISYMGTVRRVEDFGPMLFQHAVHHGLLEVDAVVFLGDGAKWVWGIQKTYFPFALTGIDQYHAIEHVNALIDLLQFKGRSGEERKQKLKDECIYLLRYGKIQEMILLVEGALCKKGCEKRFESAVNYFRSNVDHMNYGVFTALGIFVGSGVIEAACKVIVGNRMKNAGMHWSKDHAEKMIALRCAVRNGQYIDSYLSSHKSPDHLAA